MDIQILEFKKDSDNKTLLDDKENIEKLSRWVLPIIEKNIGWGTGDLTKKEFLTNPSKFQDAIDATVWNNVHVLHKDGDPLALFEYSKTYIEDEGKKRNKILQELLNGLHLDTFEKLIGKSFDKSQLDDIRMFFRQKPIYTSYGIVLKPEIQGKNLGIPEKLYELVADGILFGWTSNPVIVRLHRKFFGSTLFFPSYGEFPIQPEEWAICLYVYADRLTQDINSIAELEFGTMYSPYFVENRGDEFIKIAEVMKNQNKITKLDEKRIKYVLSKKSCAGAIVSWN